MPWQQYLLQNISHGGTKAQRREVIRKPDVSFLSLFITKNEKKQVGNAQLSNNTHNSVPLHLCERFFESDFTNINVGKVNAVALGNTCLLR